MLHPFVGSIQQYSRKSLRPTVTAWTPERVLKQPRARRHSGFVNQAGFNFMSEARIWFALDPNQEI
jgi:hypothetical protein